MTDYIHHTNNVIDRAPGPLPKAHGNTSGLDKADAATLKTLGWLPVADSGSQSAFTAAPTGVSVGDNVTPNADSVTRTHALKSLAECISIKLDELANYRYEREVGGIDVGGVAVKTDRETQSILTGARILAKEDAQYTIPSWKVTKGVFTSLDATTIITIADAVAAHVQDSFSRAETVSDIIIALTMPAAVAAYDIEAGW